MLGRQWVNSSSAGRRPWRSPLRALSSSLPTLRQSCTLEKMWEAVGSQPRSPHESCHPHPQAPSLPQEHSRLETSPPETTLSRDRLSSTTCPISAASPPKWERCLEAHPRAAGPTQALASLLEVSCFSCSDGSAGLAVSNLSRCSRSFLWWVDPSSESAPQRGGEKGSHPPLERVEGALAVKRLAEEGKSRALIWKGLLR